MQRAAAARRAGAAGAGKAATDYNDARRRLRDGRTGQRQRCRRRDAANDEVGFKLKYESTDGFKTTESQTVPDNSEWHTITWKIDDAQFDSMWGFNFELESNGKQSNKYDIQSVTVNKLTP